METIIRQFYKCRLCGNKSNTSGLCYLCKSEKPPLGTFGDGNYIYIENRTCSHCNKPLRPNRGEKNRGNFCAYCKRCGKDKKYKSPAKSEAYPYIGS